MSSAVVSDADADAEDDDAMLSDVKTAVSTDYDEFYYKLPRSTLQYVLQLELFIALMTRPRPS